jgi:hypothetical protein
MTRRYEARYEYARYKTRERAEMALENMFATGDVVEAERPEIERRGNRYVITLPM